MPTQVDFATRFIYISRILTYAVMAMALLGFLGFVIPLPFFRTLVPGLPFMNPLSTVIFFILGFTLIDDRPNTRMLRKILLSIVCSVSILKILDFFSFQINIDQIFAHTFTTTAGIPHLSFAVAVGFLLLSAAGLLRLKKPQQVRMQDFFVGIAFTMGLLVILGYWYDANFINSTVLFAHTPWRAGVGLCLLSLALVFKRPTEGVMTVFTNQTAGGVIARHLMPYVLLLPIFAWLGLRGVNLGIYNMQDGAVFVVIAYILFFQFFIWSVASRAVRIDQTRIKIVEEIKAREHELIEVNKKLADIRHDYGQSIR